MSRAVTLAGYALLVAAVLALQVVAVVGRRSATFGEAVSFVTRRRAGRWLLIAAWLWVGWHVFVRAHV